MYKTSIRSSSKSSGRRNVTENSNNTKFRASLKKTLTLTHKISDSPKNNMELIPKRHSSS